MYLFNYIMFIIVMVMSCDVISDITCIGILFSIVIIISDIININILGYIVCIISVNGAMLINKKPSLL